MEKRGLSLYNADNVFQSLMFKYRVLFVNLGKDFIMANLSTKHYRLLCLLFMASILLLSSIVIAEDKVDEKNSAELLSPVQKRMQQEVSVDFAETPIDDVLRILAKQADVDIVKSPKVMGVVTATLTDVPLAEALDNILSAHGYGYVATENMIRIVPQEEIFEVREKLVNRVYRITYADVKEVEKALNKFISNTGSLSANPGTSNIIVTDVESKIKAIDQFIEEIDRVTPQILVEAKIYDVTTKDRFDMGIQWDIGRNTSFTDGVPTGGRLDPFARAYSGDVTSLSEGSIGLIRFGVLNSALYNDFMVILQQEDISAKLLASPSVLSLDNEAATFKIVSEVPYQELTETSAGGEIGTTSFREVGVELKVVPHVTEEPSDENQGMIRLNVQPSFSVVSGEVQIGGVNIINSQPIVDTRAADIQTLVKNGDTVVIAGLRKKDVQQQLNKIPFFGDLPLLGGLFRSEGEETVNSEIFVFVTARIIEEQNLPTKPAEIKALEEMDMGDIPPARPLRVDRSAE
jgi:type IV pilus assembly protein PilQ